jgi:hypothetical protein
VNCFLSNSQAPGIPVFYASTSVFALLADEYDPAGALDHRLRHDFLARNANPGGRRLAVAPLHPYQGNYYHLVMLRISSFDCESDNTDANLNNHMHNRHLYDRIVTSCAMV